MALNTIFNTYFTSFESEMTKTGSAHADMLLGIETLFNQFDIPAEKRAEYITQAHISALNTTQGNANQAALSIIAEEKKQELLDAQIALTNSQKLKTDEETLLITAQISKVNADKLMVDAQTSKIGKDEDLVDAEILIAAERLLTQVNVTAKTASEKTLVDKEVLIAIERELTQIKQTSLLSAQVNKTIADTSLTEEQILKVTRDIDGYDDQLVLKAMENQGSLASFAVNSNSDTAQCTIDTLKLFQDKVLVRAGEIAIGTPASC